MAEDQVGQSASCYLIIVRYNNSCGAWVVNEDSRHILEDDGGGYTPQELQVHTLRALPQSVPWQYVPDEPQDSIPDKEVV